MGVSLLQVGTDKSFLPHTHDAAHPPINKTTTATNNVPRLHDDLVIFLSSYILLWFHLHTCSNTLMGASFIPGWKGCDIICYIEI